jgi:hypothetical protein
LSSLQKKSDSATCRIALSQDVRKGRQKTQESGRREPCVRLARRFPRALGRDRIQPTRVVHPRAISISSSASSAGRARKGE